MSGSEARALLRRARSAALATSLAADGSGSGWPYASLVTIACDADASPILLLSDLSDHTRNIASDGRASLLVEAASGRANPQTGPRVSLLGRITKTEEERHRRRFLARHPSAGLYAGFADFNVYRMSVERAHFIGGFGRAAWLAPEDVLLAHETAAAAAEAEPSLLAAWQGAARRGALGGRGTPAGSARRRLAAHRHRPGGLRRPATGRVGPPGLRPVGSDRG